MMLYYFASEHFELVNMSNFDVSALMVEEGIYATCLVSHFEANLIRVVLAMS